MEDFVKSFIGMVAICTTGGCVDHVVPQRPAMASTVDQEDHNSDDKYDMSNITSDRFMVFWTIDYGYRLNPENDFDTIIIPELENEDSLREFNTFFSNENLALIVGKKIYCECFGVRFERDGAIFYKIREAHLLAK